MYVNRYKAPNGTPYTGCGSYPSIALANDAAAMALDYALPGTRHIGVMQREQAERLAA